MSSSKRSNSSTDSNMQQQQQQKRRRQQQSHVLKDDNDASLQNNADWEETNETPTCQRILAEPRKRKKSLAQCDAIILEELLYPYKVNDFLNESFRKHAVHVRWKASPEPYDARIQPIQTAAAAAATTTTKHQHLRFPNIPMLQDLMDDPDIPSLVRETSSESVFVWLLKHQLRQQQQQQQQEEAVCSKSNGSNKQAKESQQLKQRDPNEGLVAPSLSPLIQSIEITDPETAIKLHEMGGHALYFRAPPHIEQMLVSSLLKSTGFGCGQYDTTKLHTSLGRGEVEVFVGGHQHMSTNRMNHPNPNKNNFVTGWHYDFQENFTIQISGVKRWTLHPGIVKHPLRGCTPHYDIVSTNSVMESQVLASRLANESMLSPTSMISGNDERSAPKTKSVSSKVEIVDMYPGDVLYFPAGMWHTVETIESGISINISLMASNFATITCQALQHFLLRNDEWRQCIQNRNGSAVEQLQHLIQSLPDVLRSAVSSNEFNARMILPPVLHEPTIVDREPVEDGEDDDDDNENETDESDTVVNISDIVLPKFIIDGVDIFHHWPVNSHQLCKNTLASLLHEEKEIRNCYTNFQPLESDRHYFPIPTEDGTSGSNNTCSVYVLNINFAGNESHESMIRYRLLLNDSTVREIKRFVNGIQPLSRGVDRLTAHHVNCLVYYGYLSWEKNK